MPLLSKVKKHPKQMLSSRNINLPAMQPILILFWGNFSIFKSSSEQIELSKLFYSYST